MIQRNLSWASVVAGILACGGVALSAQAQSSDALLKKLVENKILSQEEADALKAEAEQDSKKSFDSNFKAKTGIPDWITSYKLYGDFRGRFEENNAENDLYHSRDRYRYRLRAGINMTMLDNFDVGFRFASGNPLSSPVNNLVGGSPITANQDLNSLSS